jgi:arginyl-tRNA synthetase
MIKKNSINREKYAADLDELSALIDRVAQDLNDAKTLEEVSNIADYLYELAEKSSNLFEEIQNAVLDSENRSDLINRCKVLRATIVQMMS